MAQFLADIAGMLEIGAIAAGLVLLYRARSDAAAGLLRAAGVVLIVGGVAVGACTTWYWFSYRARGEFATAHMMPAGMMMMPMTDSGYMMGPGMWMMPGDSGRMMGSPRMMPRTTPPSDSK